MKPSTNALSAALLAAATATMLLAACSQVRSGVVEAPMMLVDGGAASVVASAAAPVLDAVAARGDLRAGDHFTGTYVCSQGSTSLDLAIDAVSAGPDTKDAVVAVFTFEYQGYPDHKGAFRMTGTLDPRSRLLKLEPDEWIDEVDGWVMVGLHGTLARGGRALSGTIDGPGCTTFSTMRSPKPPAEN